MLSVVRQYCTTDKSGLAAGCLGSIPALHLTSSGTSGNYLACASVSPFMSGNNNSTYPLGVLQGLKELMF